MLKAVLRNGVWLGVCALLMAAVLSTSAVSQQASTMNCAVNTSDPSYTNGTVRLCSQTTTGRLRVDVSGAITPSGTQNVNVIQTGSNVLVNDDAAAGTTAPVPVGGKYNATKPTYTDLDRTQWQSDLRGNLQVSIFGADSTSGLSVQSAASDGRTASNGLSVVSQGNVLNGVGTMDRTRSVVNATDSTGTGIAAAGLLGQFDETSPTTVTENQFGNLRMTSQGVLYTEEAGRSFNHITAAAPTATVVKSGRGYLHALCINTPAATGVITVYDNTSAAGTVIAVITQPAVLLSTMPACIQYDVAFGTGLTINTATAAQDLTISYR